MGGLEKSHLRVYNPGGAGNSQAAFPLWDLVSTPLNLCSIDSFSLIHSPYKNILLLSESSLHWQERSLAG